MLTKPVVPLACAGIVMLSFSLSLFSALGRADTISQDGTKREPQGAQCCYAGDGLQCPYGSQYGCQPPHQGDSFNCGSTPCALWNITDVYTVGKCTNGYRTNCTEWNPFYCAYGPLYTDPDNTGLCLAENYQCDLYQPVNFYGCPYDSSNNCNATN